MTVRMKRNEKNEKERPRSHQADFSVPNLPNFSYFWSHPQAKEAKEASRKANSLLLNRFLLPWLPCRVCEYVGIWQSNWWFSRLASFSRSSHCDAVLPKRPIMLHPPLHNSLHLDLYVNLCRGSCSVGFLGPTLKHRHTHSNKTHKASMRSELQFASISNKFFRKIW